MFQPTDTITRILKEHPAAARVFERNGIEFCCAGATTLEEASGDRGIPTEILLADLRALLEPQAEHACISGLPLTGMAAHVEEVHHGYLREELPRLDAMTARVAAVHGNRDARLNSVREVWAALSATMAAHLEKEEQILFPMIRALEDESAPVDFHCGSVTNPIAQMESEHREIEEAIARLHALTEGYVPPAWACGTYRAMLEALSRFESDTLEHTLKEEVHLFPGAVAREAARDGVRAP
jgi:regulator of cell morphogenesis and NO signaling